MTKKILQCSLDTIDHIIHISDIHIRNYKRHDEYRFVFDNLYCQIRELSSNSLICVTGDIVHSKTDMSPELIDLVIDFFTNLSKLRPTIVITGNHDANLNNHHRLDALSPIVKGLNLNDFFYLKDSGIYTLAGIDFVVMSLFDDPSSWIRAKDFEGEYKVALYHGTVNNSQTDTGYVVENAKVTTRKFSGYDLVLLGDIHKVQYLNRHETIAYAGSLIQQNFGESFKGHGFLYWDLSKRKSQFFEVNNDWGYYTIDLIGDQCSDYSDLPPKAKVRLRTQDSTESDIKSAIIKIKRDSGYHDFIVMKKSESTIKDSQNDLLENVWNVRDVNYQNTLIIDFLRSKYPEITDEEIQNVCDINRELNQNLVGEWNRYVFWKPKKFEFSNMFSYGEDNSIDFSSINGLIGIFAPNHSGKSALLDALSFCIFDKSSRSKRGDDVLNNRKDWFSCKLNFEVDGVDYFIERKGTKTKYGSVRVDTDFWMINEDGKPQSLNGEQRKDTNQVIRSILGNYEDFAMTALSVQNDNTGFIDSRQGDRKEILTHFLNLGIFDSLFQMANDDVRDVFSLLREFKNTDYSDQLLESEASLKDSRLRLTALDEERSSYENNLQFIQTQIEDLNHRIQNLSQFDFDPNEIQTQINTLSRSIGTKKLEIESLSSQVLEIDQRIQSYPNNLDDLYQDHLQQQNKVSQIKDKLLELKSSIRTKETNLSHLQDKLHAIGQFDPNCDFCKMTPFVQSATKLASDIKILQNDVNDLKSVYDSVFLKYEQLKDSSSSNNLVNQWESKNKDERELIQVVHNRSSAELELVKLETQSKDLTFKLDQYYDNESKINTNNELISQINDLKIKRSDINSKIISIANMHKEIYGKIKVLDTRIKNIKDAIKRAKELEIKHRSYQYYLEAVKMDGLPYRLISNIIPEIQDNVNEILSQMVDFRLMFDLDGKNINTYIVYDDDRVWKLELTSGMEKFISSIAIRVALVEISSLPRPNFLAIDEGFSNLDSSNLSSISQLFEFLKEQFESIFIISHIDIMRDIVDQSIQIDKYNNYSKISVH